MTPEEIIEGNKLIAEFMGWSQADYMPVSEYLKPPKDFVITHNHKDFEWSAYKIDALQYHTSWDWLMPVVEKIVQEHSIFRLTMGNTGNVAHFEDSDLKKSYDTSPIQAVYTVVLQFINWYNTTQK